MSQIKTVVKRAGNWMRLSVAAKVPLKEVLLDVLHHPSLGQGSGTVGLTKDYHDLHKELTTFKTKFWKDKKLSKVVKFHQWDKICHTCDPNNCPVPCQRQGITNSKELDITCIVILIRNLEKILTNINKAAWQNFLPFLQESLEIRNTLMHSPLEEFDDQTKFDNFWVRIENNLKNLQCRKANMTLFNGIETSSLEPYLQQQVEALEDKCQDLEDTKCNQKDMDSTQADLIKLQHEITTLQKSCKDMDETKCDKKELDHARNDIDSLQRNVACLMDKTGKKIATKDYVDERIESLKVGKESSVADLTDQVQNIEDKQNLKQKFVESSISKLEDDVLKHTSKRRKLESSVADLTDQVQNIEEKQNSKQKFVDPNNYVIQEALSILEEMMQEKDELMFSKRLGLPGNTPLRECQIQWQDLKPQLHFIKRNDIVERIQNETEITIGNQQNLQHHRDILNQCLGQKTCTLPFFDSYGRKEVYKDGSMDDLYVQLSILSGGSVDKKWLNSDRTYHLKQHLLDKNEIEMKDILTTSCNSVVISGTAGIGKSTLVDKITLEWSKGNLFNGKDDNPNVSLLIPVKCREINNLKLTDETSIIDVIHAIHPHLTISRETFKELRNRITLLVDGVDELIGIDTINSSDKENHTRILHQMLNPKTSPASRYIVVGRPRIARKIGEWFGENFNEKTIKSIEISGFSSESIKTYIDRVFIGRKSKNISRLTENIESSVTLKALATVPIYLWALCGLYYQQPMADIPETSTELLLYLLLLFQQNHWGNKQKQTSFLGKLIKNKETLQHTKEIAAVAYYTLSNKKVIYQLPEDQDNSTYKDLEKMGFVVKVNNPDRGVVRYEFRHLVLQELLTAIHIVLHENIKEKKNMLKNDNLRGCLVLVAGLEGLSACTDKISLLSRYMNSLYSLSSPDKVSKRTFIEKVEKKFVEETGYNKGCVQASSPATIYLCEYKEISDNLANYLIRCDDLELIYTIPMMGRNSFDNNLLTRDDSRHQRVNYLAEQFINKKLKFTIDPPWMAASTIQSIGVNMFQRIVPFCKDFHFVIDSSSIETLSPYATILSESGHSYKISLEDKTEEISQGSTFYKAILPCLLRAKGVEFKYQVNKIFVDALLMNYTTSIESLSVGRCNATESNLTKILRMFNSVHISCSLFLKDQFKEFSETIHKDSPLRKLVMTECYVGDKSRLLSTDDSMDVLLPCLPFLQKIDFSKNELTTKSLYGIVKAIFTENSLLTEVKLSRNSFNKVSNEEKKEMREYLSAFDFQTCTREISLGLSETRLTSKVFIPMIDILKSNISISFHDHDFSSRTSNAIQKRMLSWKEKDINVQLSSINIDGSESDDERKISCVDTSSDEDGCEQHETVSNDDDLKVFMQKNFPKVSVSNGYDDSDYGGLFEDRSEDDVYCPDSRYENDFFSDDDEVSEDDII